MTASYVQGVTVFLGDNAAEIAADYGQGTHGEFGLLHIGDRLTLHVSLASPEALDALAHAAAELAAWKRRQQAEAVAA